MKAAAIFLFLTLPYSLLAKCPIGSTQGVVGTQCFVFRGRPTAFVAAEEDCVSQKGHLASIQSSLTNRFLSGLMSGYGVNELWLGGDYDLFTQNAWSWTDGTRWQ